MLGMPCGNLAKRQLATVWLARGQLARGSGLCLRIYYKYLTGLAPRDDARERVAMTSVGTHTKGPLI